MGQFYVVATPIGNLEDVTLRALRVLKEADAVFAEDTRVTKKLLSHYDIPTPLRSYHQQSGPKKMEEVLELLLQGKNIALVTDSGTPGISDPGNELIAFLLKKSEVRVVPIPGPSAVSAIASIAGFPMNEFLFAGYPPHKKKRKQFFQEIAQSPRPAIFYESPHRIVKSLEELKEADPNLELVVGRELTKQFESVYRGNAGEVVEELSREKIRGEFAVAVWRGH